MAHSDALIFLTNITWIFFLFLFTYFFFVCLVLPTFYKKFRTRVLIKNINFLGGILAVRNVLVSLVFCVDVFRGLSLIVAASLKAALGFLKTNTLSQISLAHNASSVTTPIALDSSEIVRKYNLNLMFVDLSTNGNVVFTRFLAAQNKI